MNIPENSKTIVFGANGLLGTQLVGELLKHGGQVIAVDRDVDDLLGKFEQQSVSRIIPKKLDITCESEVIEFFDTLDQSVTGAVNCTYPRNSAYGAHFFDVTLSSFNENISLHLGSTFFITQQCAAYFKKNQNSFSLINISSVYGVVAPKFNIYDNTPMTMPVEYAAIKSAILHLNKYVSTYINDSRFRINCVSPGGIFDHQPESFCKAYKEHTNGAGMLDVSEVIGSIVFLLSDRARYVTGQNIIVDDGFSL